MDAYADTTARSVRVVVAVFVVGGTGVRHGEVRVGEVAVGVVGVGGGVEVGIVVEGPGGAEDGGV